MEQGSNEHRPPPTRAVIDDALATMTMAMDRFVASVEAGGLQRLTKTEFLTFARDYERFRSRLLRLEGQLRAKASVSNGARAVADKGG